MPQTIWIVKKGESHEGSYVVAVCATEELAKRRVMIYIAEDFPNTWEPSGEWDWRNGCEYLCVREYAVQQ